MARLDCFRSIELFSAEFLSDKPGFLALKSFFLAGGGGAGWASWLCATPFIFKVYMLRSRFNIFFVQTN